MSEIYNYHEYKILLPVNFDSNFLYVVNPHDLAFIIEKGVSKLLETKQLEEDKIKRLHYLISSIKQLQTQLRKTRITYKDLQEINITKENVLEFGSLPSLLLMIANNNTSKDIHYYLQKDVVKNLDILLSKEDNNQLVLFE